MSTEPSTLADTLASELDLRLADADAALARDFPGERPGRQPVHTVYVPADRFEEGLCAAWGRAALEALDAHPAEFRAVITSAPATPPATPATSATLGASGADGSVDPDALEAAVRRKLETEPVEDLRIDVEDGYGIRPGAEEDADVDRAVRRLLAAVRDGRLPRSPASGSRRSRPRPGAEGCAP